MKRITGLLAVLAIAVTVSACGDDNETTTVVTEAAPPPATVTEVPPATVTETETTGTETLAPCPPGEVRAAPDNTCQPMAPE